MKKRKDTWTREEDDLLSGTIIDYIKNGKAQLEAFEIVGQQISRTARACGFRWNAELRKQYTQEINVAKQQRLMAKKADRLKNKSVTVSGEGEIDLLDQIFEQVLQFRYMIEKMNMEMNSLNGQLNKSNLRVKELETEITDLKKGKMDTGISEDYQALMQLFSRARELGLIHSSNGISGSRSTEWKHII